MTGQEKVSGEGGPSGKPLGGRLGRTDHKGIARSTIANARVAMPIKVIGNDPGKRLTRNSAAVYTITQEQKESPAPSGGPFM
jgi:hypothetical protein